MTYPKRHWRSSSLKKLRVSNLVLGPNILRRYAHEASGRNWDSRLDNVKNIASNWSGVRVWAPTYQIYQLSKQYEGATFSGLGEVKGGSELISKRSFLEKVHQKLTLSSPYRWWFCGLMSTLPLLPPAPPHCRCDLLSPSWFLLPYAVIHITWNPWVSFVKSSLLRNGIRNQLALFFFFPSLFFSPPLRACHSLQFGGNFVFLSQDKPVFVCL